MTDPAGGGAEDAGRDGHQRDRQRRAPVARAVELADDDGAHGDVPRHREVDAAEDEHERLPERGKPEQRGEDQHRVDGDLAAEAVDGGRAVEEQHHQREQLEHRRAALERERLAHAVAPRGRRVSSFAPTTTPATSRQP